jgi:hypothetical protein
MSGVSVVVADNVPVGTMEVLHSPHVSEGPGRIARAPVPSVYVDDRGDIHRIRVGHQRLNLLYSKRGVMRSGYLHPHSLHSIVISGQVEVWTLTSTGTNKQSYQQYEHFTIPPYVPHILYFPFTDDTILAEWWSPPNAEFQCFYYHPYRKIIDIQNSLRMRELECDPNRSTSTSISGTPATSTGRHQRLIPQDEAQLKEANWSTSLLRWSSWLLTVSMATGVGIAIGMTISDPSSSTDRTKSTPSRL